MKRVLAIVKPFRAAETLAGLARLRVGEALACEARGYGRQKDKLERYRHAEYHAAQLPKIEFRLHCADEGVEAAIAAIVAAARDGAVGSGKIMVLPCLGMVEF